MKNLFFTCLFLFIFYDIVFAQEPPVVLSTTSALTPTTVTPAPCVLLTFDTENCYWAWTDLFNYTTAEAICIDWGGHLISIHSTEVNGGIGTMIKAMDSLVENFWSGGRYTLATDWTWTDGSSFDFTNWDRGLLTKLFFALQERV